MSVALLFISHRHNDVLASAQQQSDLLHTADGLVIITDMFGDTPSNIVHTLAKRYRAPMISGPNQPMLTRIYNYGDASSKPSVATSKVLCCTPARKTNATQS